MGHTDKTITTQSENETAAVGRDLAAALSAGDVVLLYGDLGAGKTAFVRGLAEGLGVGAYYLVFSLAVVDVWRQQRDAALAALREIHRELVGILGFDRQQRGR